MELMCDLPDWIKVYLLVQAALHLILIISVPIIWIADNIFCLH